MGCEVMGTIWRGASEFPGPVKPEEVPRLRRQHEVIRDFMLRHNRWHSLRHIAAHTGYPEASISANLRHLRKQSFGAYRVEKMRAGGGVWLYRVLPPLATGQMDLLR